MITLKHSKLKFYKKFSVIYVLITFALMTVTLNTTYSSYKSNPNMEISALLVSGILVLLIASLFIFSVYAYNYIKKLDVVYSDYFTQNQIISITKLSTETELNEQIIKRHALMLTDNKKEAKNIDSNSTIKFE